MSVTSMTPVVPGGAIDSLEAVEVVSPWFESRPGVGDSVSLGHDARSDCGRFTSVRFRSENTWRSVCTTVRTV